MASCWKGLFISSLLCYTSISMALTAEQQQAMTPKQGLQQLIAGNQRFSSNKLQHEAYASIAADLLAPEQYPLGVIFSCMDSRSVPDILFDQDMGNIFGVRVAGNVTDKNILGSMEYAVKVTGAKVIVVLGHTQCGAVKGACQGVKLGNLTTLLQQMAPAVQKVKLAEGTAFSCDSQTTVDAIAKQNVLEQLAYITQHSAIIRQAEKAQEVILVGGMYNIATGSVDFFDSQGQTMTTLANSP